MGISSMRPNSGQHPLSPHPSHIAIGLYHPGTTMHMQVQYVLQLSCTNTVGRTSHISTSLNTVWLQGCWTYYSYLHLHPLPIMIMLQITVSFSQHAWCNYSKLEVFPHLSLSPPAGRCERCTRCRKLRRWGRCRSPAVIFDLSML